MNEEHIIAAILTAGLVSNYKQSDTTPKDIVTLYGECLAEFIESTRPHRSNEEE
jgi:hypothetical protein